MTDRQKYLEDLRDNYSDRTALAFADWLRKNGEPQRAEFIWLGIMLSRKGLFTFTGPYLTEKAHSCPECGRIGILLGAPHQEWCRLVVMERRYVELEKLRDQGMMDLMSRLDSPS